MYFPAYPYNILKLRFGVESRVVDSSSGGRTHKAAAAAVIKSGCGPERDNKELNLFANEVLVSLPLSVNIFLAHIIAVTADAGGAITQPVP